MREAKNPIAGATALQRSLLRIRERRRIVDDEPVEWAARRPELTPAQYRVRARGIHETFLAGELTADRPAV
ncbi:MAG: hypothetical protein ACKVU1_00600 [bacterium]